MPVQQEIILRFPSNKSLNHTGHQVSDNDEVADAHAKAFDGNGSVENDSGIRVRDLREGEERGGPSFQVLRASRLEI